MKIICGDSELRQFPNIKYLNMLGALPRGDFYSLKLSSGAKSTAATLHIRTFHFLAFP